MRLARKHGILFIADEIATGFWRTGRAFACDEAGISPDILCLGKALTGGTIGMGATLASEEIFASFLSDDWDDRAHARPDIHGQPAGLRGRQRLARPVRARAERRRR